ncbi:uncharacterized protein MKK02DRAFT_43689 [Dioszegia hungarica]|uniref:Uncharacterized protein n=1 Tax=Dioszegia hungarica TaxID=4972 RepID=A0AA38H6R8_9TREE|nr:uncharacterized protein MKK02DRAFT_43689 [Dioszegia hungarica]KAI9635013.1 hypothetical protein MKK02DRAFT_43689 [Dioszegia hungarica]
MAIPSPTDQPTPSTSASTSGLVAITTDRSTSPDLASNPDAESGPSAATGLDKRPSTSLAPLNTLRSYFPEPALSAIIEKYRHAPDEPSPLSFPPLSVGDIESESSGDSEDEDEDGMDEDWEDDDEDEDDHEGMYPARVGDEDTSRHTYPPQSTPPRIPPFTPKSEQSRSDRHRAPSPDNKDRRHCPPGSAISSDITDPFEWLGRTSDPLSRPGNPPPTSPPLRTDSPPPPSPRPAHSELGGSALLQRPSGVKLRIKALSLSSPDSLDPGPRSTTPMDPSPAAHGVSISPGSSRTKIVIRRTGPEWPTFSPPSSSSALPGITMGRDDDVDAVAIQDDEDLPLTPRDLREDRVRIRRNAARHCSSDMTYIYLGGRRKDFRTSNLRICAAISNWYNTVTIRCSPAELYKAMRTVPPMLASPPPGFDAIVSPSGLGWDRGEDEEMSYHRTVSLPPKKRSQTAKRLRYSPETILRGMERGGKEVQPGDAVSPEERRIKKGKISARAGGARSLDLPDEEEMDIDLGQSGGSSDWTVTIQSDPADNASSSLEKATANTPGTPSSSISQYVAHPRTGRRMCITTDPSRTPPSSPLPGDSATATPGTREWEVAHLEHVEDWPMASPPGRSVQEISSLGLDLGGYTSSPPSLQPPPDVTRTPHFTFDYDADDQDMLSEEEGRARLCAAIEKLAAEQHRSRDADSTPPMRETGGIDDTPESVVDELITTPDVDISALPASSSVSEAPKVSPDPDEDEEEEEPRPRLDKGKGRARPEDEPQRRADDGTPRLDQRQHTVPRRPVRPPRPVQDVQVELEGLVMEVSRLEAQLADMGRQEGEGSPGVPRGNKLLSRRISLMNREIEKLSQNYLTMNMPAPMARETQPRPETIIESDETLAARLQREYEDEDAQIAIMEYNAEQNPPEEMMRPFPGSVQSPRRYTPLDREMEARRAAIMPGVVRTPPQYTPYEPNVIPRRQAARQLTFDSPKATTGVPMAREPSPRVPVTGLLARSTIFESGLPDLPTEPTRSRSKSPASSGPIAIPTLPPMLVPSEPSVRITVTPPTPVIPLRADPLRRSQLSRSNPSDYVAEQLGASALQRDRDGDGVEILIDEVPEEEEGRFILHDLAEEADEEDSDSSSDTIRPRSRGSGRTPSPPDEDSLELWHREISALLPDRPTGGQLPFRRVLSEPFDLTDRPKQVRRLSADDVAMDDSPPLAPRVALDLERPPTGILFDPDKYEEDEVDIAHREPGDDKVRNKAHDDTSIIQHSTEITPPARADDSPLTYSPPLPRPLNESFLELDDAFPPSISDSEHQHYHTADTWLPGELAERLGIEVMRMARQARRLRRRRVRRVLLLVARVGVVVLLSWIFFGRWGFQL